MLAATPAGAVVFFSSGDPAFNATAPTGPLAGSGWELQGSWVGFLGTPVAPNFFLTATHVGGTVGNSISVGGIPYTTTAKFDHPTADFTLWQIAGVFPTYAPLYTGSDEAGKSMVLFGRSSARGAEVNVTGASVGDLRGWLWGAGTEAQRWGENVVDTAILLGPGNGFLTASLTRGAGVNEATVASGDSGGGVFIQDGGIWKLAGINFAVEAAFRTSAGGSTFNAAIFDAGGLYFDFDGSGPNPFLLVPDLAGDQVPSMYASRVSTHAGWIESTTGVPEPRWMAAATGCGLILWGVARRRRKA